MKRIRKAKATQRKTTEPNAAPNSHAQQQAWQSVMADAEERMAQLRRTIEWAKQYRNHQDFSSDSRRAARDDHARPEQ